MSKTKLIAAIGGTIMIGVILLFANGTTNFQGSLQLSDSGPCEMLTFYKQKYAKSKELHDKMVESEKFTKAEIAQSKAELEEIATAAKSYNLHCKSFRAEETKRANQEAFNSETPNEEVPLEPSESISLIAEPDSDSVTEDTHFGVATEVQVIETTNPLNSEVVNHIIYTESNQLAYELDLIAIDGYAQLDKVNINPTMYHGYNLDRIIPTARIIANGQTYETNLVRENEYNLNLLNQYIFNLDRPIILNPNEPVRVQLFIDVINDSASGRTLNIHVYDDSMDPILRTFDFSYENETVPYDIYHLVYRINENNRQVQVPAEPIIGAMHNRLHIRRAR